MRAIAFLKWCDRSCTLTQCVERWLELGICAKLISYFSTLTIGKHLIRLGIFQIYLLQPVEICDRV
ncbi:hypothetical protein [Nostoc sp. WHI]|uniref:hypothetical protein n=1 Tax=Nostoc sp. WHI TaxID=2650611 RepID=UPI0018C50500|nr:hypothetical protein [Nostoc sp. WHI]